MNQQALDRTQEIEQGLDFMGTAVRIRIRSPEVVAAQAAIAAAFAEMQRLEQVMTEFREDSELMDLNRRGHQEWVTVDPALFQCIQEGVEMGRISGGAFDITWRGAGKLWDFKAKPPRLPDPEAIRAALPLIDYRHVLLDHEQCRVRLNHAGTRIGLGGVGKGAIIDAGVRVIRERGFKHFLVNGGGDIFAGGRNHGGKLWWAAIRDPRHNDRNLAIIPLANMAVVTSGDYERFFMHEGRMYCHIIDPRSGYPARACQSVTILAKTTARADALATAVFVLGPQRGLELVATLPDTQALIVDEAGVIHASKGLLSS